MRILGVLFDLNGVLVDSLNLHAQAWSKALTMNKHPISKEELRSHSQFGKYGGVELVKLLNQDISDNLAQKIEEDYEKEYRELAEKHLKSFPDAEETLKHLDGMGLKLGIIANDKRETIEKDLAKVGLKDYFEVLTGLDEVKKGKPSPEMIVLACKRLFMKPYHAFVIGDSTSEMIAAKQVLSLSIGVTTGACTAEELKEAGAQFIVDKLIEIVPIIERFG
jgi:HAD superfamily hydrolase (TIGR01549 family)